ncbi:hypothetical protein [Luteipulveratus halotolerans]|uniref:Uncharacterized protein n=1 Tax=Luteipulveratus halotolerans TaxID=1631356 RepID=A0A0L6CPQ0_9MICO|nr:hypothetical protein [Luteipulveratus halotolerans]KNX39722.1 hypothetical protein VV01_00375 [Luteipulveratus halotolerans]
MSRTARPTTEACRILDAIHDEALSKADRWLGEVEQGRAGVATLDYVRDLMEIVHAIQARRIPRA